MIIFPAIDIKDGKCVRLKQGKFDKVKVFSDNPVHIAKEWQESGCKYLHIVDLDGALNGIQTNISTIRNIVRSIDIPIQLGGGIRDCETVEKLLKSGVERVILGTAALENRDLLKKIVDKYDERIVVSIDAKNGYVAKEGWTKISSVESVSFIKKLEEIGIKSIVYTDILKDGMMRGPNFQIYEIIKTKTNLDIIASGGISSLEDIERLNNIGVYGCIIGKALYNGSLNLNEVLDKINNNI